MTHHNFTFDNASTALPKLMRHVLLSGEDVPARGGTSTKELRYVHVELQNPQRREIIHPERAASLPAQIAETMWILAGRNDIDWLSHYLPRAKDFSDDGKVWRGGYGPRLREWRGATDQLAAVVDLLKREPDTRRAVISIFDPDIDHQDGKDIPCNNWLHFLQRNGTLDLHVVIRSNDLMWGWSGINAFEWSALLEIVAGLVGAKVGSLHFGISSLHLYDRHFAKADRIALVSGDAAAPSPKFRMSPQADSSVEVLDSLILKWFEAEADLRAGRYVDVSAFPEPMMRSWLAVIAWWWTGSDWYLEPYKGTRLEVAARLSPNRPTPEPAPEPDPFVKFVADLHADKHAVYGDSWKRRGEQIGIMANIARKVDRLGVAGGGDTAADTVIDLLVYLIKYRWWLSETYGLREPLHGDISDEVGRVTEVLKTLDAFRQDAHPTNDIALLTEQFEVLEQHVTKNRDALGRETLVDKMAPIAYRVARALWEKEQWHKGNETRAWNPEVVSS